MTTYQVFERWQAGTIREGLSQSRVLLLEGPRQCGKTTLAKLIGEDPGARAIYRTLDDQTLLNAALEDPHGFVAHGDQLMIIDEVQRAPQLLAAVKKDVDENQKPGRFLLTGSANIMTLPKVKESLAGRVRKVRLRPLAQGEIERNKPHFLEIARAGGWRDISASGDQLSKDAYIEMALAGGYPEAVRLHQGRARRQWHNDYLEALIDRDLRDVANIRRKDNLFKLVEVLAAWSSRFMDATAISAALGTSRPTLETYINALETLYLVDRLTPWSKTDYARVGKQDKLFITDTGLMGSTLNWSFEKVRLDGSLNGKLIETLVYAQLTALLESQAEDFRLYHYRDREQRELDFLIEGEDGQLIGIEVKAGSNVEQRDFRHLKWFRDNLAGGREFQGLVLYTGEQRAAFGPQMWAVPISMLFRG
ncbi:MAG: AAA family ATPase [Alphaproteobacteria bacterium PA2]|nr:MAG: AAA family ATPase [Alphaproteobacteria bacterium PA2]